MKVHLAYPRPRPGPRGAAPPANADALLARSWPGHPAQRHGRRRQVPARRRAGPLLRQPRRPRSRSGTGRRSSPTASRTPTSSRELYAIAVDGGRGGAQALDLLDPLSRSRCSIGPIGAAGPLRRDRCAGMREIAREHGTRLRVRRASGASSRELDRRAGRRATCATVEEHLRRLRFRGGVILLSATLGRGATPTPAYVLRRRVGRRGWRERIGPGGGREPHVGARPPRRRPGRRRWAPCAAGASPWRRAPLGESTDHILSYFAQLRAELGLLRGLPATCRCPAAQGRAGLHARADGGRFTGRSRPGACTTRR